MPTVSLVIPTRNCRAELARLLDSIDRQTFRDLEVIVVDNFSTEQVYGLDHSATAIEWIKVSFSE